MDEPTSDMDPVTRAIVYRTIERLNSQNRSILLTSHSISEIDHICQRIAILKDGRLLTVDTPESLTQRYGNNYLITIYLEDNREVDLVRVSLRSHTSFFEINNATLRFPNPTVHQARVQRQPGAGPEQKLAPVCGQGAADGASCASAANHRCGEATQKEPGYDQPEQQHDRFQPGVGE